VLNYSRKLYALFSSWSLLELSFLVLMMVGITILEMIGISLFLPLMQALITPGTPSDFPILRDVIEYIDPTSSSSLIAVLAILIFIFFNIKNALLLIVVWQQNKFINEKTALFSTTLLKMYLSMPYAFYLRRNSSELTRNIYDSTTVVLLGGLLSILNLLLEGLMIIGIVVVLAIVDPGVTFTAMGVLGVTLASIYYAFRRKLELWGREKQIRDAQKLQWIKQAFGSVKETKVLGREEFFVSAFAQPAYRLARIATSEATLHRAVSASSEVVLIGGVTLILLLSLWGSDGSSNANLLTTLGLFAVAGFRILPSANKITANLIKLRKSIAAIDDIYADLIEWESRKKADSPETMFPALQNSLLIEDVSLTYEGASAPAVSNVSIEIKRGQTTALVGASGAGKSSVIDLLLGLHTPDSGQILVDDHKISSNIRGWQRHIGYVPQSIFLIDDTLRKNIAIGLEDAEIDEEAISKAINFANLTGLVEKLEDGVDTHVGENGVRLSGGERQRVGIARALYHNPDVLILDEATSALDNQTEHEISVSLQALSGQKTLLIIAHRLSTIRHADQIILMEAGKCVDSGSFDELLQQNDLFRNFVNQGLLIGSIDTPNGAVA